MRFVTVRDVRSSSARIWKELSITKEMIITNNGKPVALLTPVSDRTMEPTLRAVRRALASSAIERLQSDARGNRTSGISAEEIEAEIEATRVDVSGNTDR